MEEVPSRLTLWAQGARHSVDRLLLSPARQHTAFPLLLLLYGCMLLLNLGAHLLGMWRPDLAGVLLAGLDVDPLSSSANTVLFLLMNGVRLVVVVLSWVAALQLRQGSSSGWRTAHRALLLSVVAADVLSFYFSQFSAAIIALIDVLLLNGVNHVLRVSLRKARADERPPEAIG
jgi:hypothetical protein